jgi:hypothetical protein
MKMRIVSSLLMLSMVCVPVGAAIDQIVIEQAITTGGVAEYDHTTSEIVWSGGASVFFLDGELNVYSSTEIEWEALFTDPLDDSSDGDAKAVFYNNANPNPDRGKWSLNVWAPLDTTHLETNIIATLSGHVVGRYYEDEIQDDKLYGRAVVMVDSVELLPGLFGDPAVWDGGEWSLAGIKADITLPTNSNFGDYDTDSYITSNTIITIVSDETTIPEPVTIALLGLGSLVGLRRRKRL